MQALSKNIWKNGKQPLREANEMKLNELLEIVAKGEDSLNQFKEDIGPKPDSSTTQRAVCSPL